MKLCIAALMWAEEFFVLWSNQSRCFHVTPSLCIRHNWLIPNSSSARFDNPPPSIAHLCSIVLTAARWSAVLCFLSTMCTSAPHSTSVLPIFVFVKINYTKFKMIIEITITITLFSSTHIQEVVIELFTLLNDLLDGWNVRVEGR